MSRKAELIITVIGDAALTVLAFIISWKASAIQHSVVGARAIVANVFVLAYWLFIFQTANLYLRRAKIQLINEVLRMLKTIAIGLLILISAAFVLDLGFVLEKGFMPAYALSLSSLIVWRFFWRGLLGEYFKPKPEKVVIFHNNDVNRDPGYFNIVQRISLSKLHRAPKQLLAHNNNIDGILIDSNGAHTEEVMKVISSFADTNYEIYVSPKLYPVIYNYSLVEKVENSPFLKIIFHPLSAWDRFLKRMIDIFISVVSLVVLAPILGVLALLIKIDTPGPVFHKQDRVGLRGRKFTLIKFRSMVADAEKLTGPVWAAKNDRRTTRVGRVMRPYRLDELPQIFNVLKGEMSFVGPRPERPSFVERFRKTIPLYGLRLTVNPGLTGWAQVKHTYDQSFDDVKKKLGFDLEYINNMSIRLDLKIFLKTVLTVMKREGAH